MSRPIDKITVLNRGKKGSKHVQKCNVSNFCTTPENAVRNPDPTTSIKEHVATELPLVYDSNQIETLVSDERSKHSPFPSLTPTSPDYETLKCSHGEVDFGGGNCGEFHNSLPRIVDLCLEDKKRILQLINELANCKEEKEIMTRELSNLKELVQQQMNEMAITNEKFATQKEALALEACSFINIYTNVIDYTIINFILFYPHQVENLVTSRDNLSADLENLQNCVEIQKNEIEKQATCIAALKAEKKHLQKQVTEQENKLKVAVSNVDTLTEKLLFYEPRNKMKMDNACPASPKNKDIQMSSKFCIHQGEKPRLVHSNDTKVEGCSGDAGTHVLQDSMSCSANTDVGFFAVRMCPDLGSGAALVVCRPTEQQMAHR
ncbi:Protein hinderin [Gryllus bimaculatus]|nr:Protein hinderin [Gryllus bimaculatus]